MDKKENILKQLLKQVVFDGWTNKSLEKASEAAGFDIKYGYIEFPNGIADAAEYFIKSNDAEMEKKLKKSGLEKMKIRERIATAVLTRLRLYENHREAVRKLVAFYALPQNAGKAVSNISNTVSKMWYAAGDTSSDFNYYTKRFLLAGVYSSTLLYWLNDDSDKFRNTEDFLRRRIDDVMKIQKIRGKAEKTIENIRKTILKG